MIDERLARQHPDATSACTSTPGCRHEPQMLGPLLYALRDALAADPKRRFLETAKRLGTILVTLGSDVLLRTLSANSLSLAAWGELEKRYADARGVVESQTRRLRQTLQDEADKVAGQGARIVFFIDDLDRCGPAEIVDLLESLKLFLDIRNVLVLMAISKDLVDRGIAVKYRDFGFADEHRSVVGDEYLDKLIQLPLYLLPIDNAGVGQFLRELDCPPYVRAHLDLLQRVLVPNPRKIKRVLNLLAVTGAIAGGELRPDLVARLVVLRIQSPALFLDVAANPSLLRAMELLYQKKLQVDVVGPFRQHFADEGDRLRELALKHYGTQRYLAALFDGSTFDEVAAALPTYLTMLGS